MYKNLIIIFLALSAWSLEAQTASAKTMPLIPDATFIQQFGEDNLTISYARPSARGRKVFGGLVPLDTLWRTGASDCTTLEFKKPILIGSKLLAGGKYALFTIPRQDTWTVVLNTDATLHGTFGYDAKKDIHRFDVKPVSTTRFYETFTIEISDCTPQGTAFLNIMWENTMIQIPLQVAP